jgi:hypothetical protein
VQYLQQTPDVAAGIRVETGPVVLVGPGRVVGNRVALDGGRGVSVAGDNVIDSLGVSVAVGFGVLDEPGVFVLPPHAREATTNAESAIRK